MNLTVIIPFFNGHQYIDRLVMSISRTQPILVVDDHSEEPLDPHLTNRIYRNVTVIRPGEKGYFAGAVNAGLLQTTGDVLVLNQDVWFDDGGWEWLVAKLANQDPRTAISGDGVFGHPAWPMGYVQGTLMYLKRDAVDQIGLLNQVDYPLWGGTAEWQLRAVRKGWRANPWPWIEGFHHARPKGVNYGSSIQQVLDEQPDAKAKMIRTPPMVSVIIPTYNHAKYLPDAVASLIGGNTQFGYTTGQTFESFEVIIVDDASTDNTQEVGESLADPWTAVRYIRRAQNGGTPATNNTGIKAAYGKYVTILCADDLREEGSLERLVDAAEANPHSIIYDDVILKLSGSGRERIWELPDYDFDRLLERNFMHAGILFPRRAWEEIGGYPEVMRQGREDWAVNVALGIKGYCGVHIKTPGYIYRRHDSNRTLTNTNPEWRDHFVSQMRALFTDVYEGRRPMACCGKSDPLPGGPAPAGAQSLIGADGMTLLTYQGGNWGDEAYYGPVTGTRYVFSKSHPTRLVDDRDLRTDNGRGLLDLWEGGNYIFAEAKPARATAARIAAAAPEPPPYIEPDPVPAPKADDLTQIKGVGKETAAKLAQMGFTTFRAVAKMNAESMSAVLGMPKARLEKIIAAAGDLVYDA